MSFTVVFIVSSSVQSIPNAVRAKGQSSPPNSPLLTLALDMAHSGLVSFCNVGPLLQYHGDKKN